MEMGRTFAFLGNISLCGLHETGWVLVRSACWTVGSAVFLVLALIIAVATYRILFHPLASIPGPKLAALSNIWQAYYARNGRMLELGKTLHAKYGPVVRVGPDEVWFDSTEAFRFVYGKYFRLSPTFSP